MSAKTFIKPFKVLSAGDMSQATLTSAVTATQLVDNIGYQINFTGAPVGIFAVQISQDYEPGRSPNSEPVNAGNWISVPLSPAITAAGSPDSAYIDLNQMSAPYVRIVYTRTSGTGVLNIYVTAKAI